jgi:hypothetical protein
MGSVSRLNRTNVRRSVTLTYRDAQGNHMECDISEAAHIAFEAVQPVRGFAFLPTQKHTPGKFWSQTSQCHLNYESYLESRWLLLYDHDPEVSGISTQPCQIDCLDTEGSWRHTPDFFLRRSSGQGCVIDVKPARFVDEGVRLQANRTAEVCAEIGWGYELVTEPEAQYLANIEWISAYRRCTPDDGVLRQVMHLARQPVSISELVTGLASPTAMSSIGYLLWTGELVTDLTKSISRSTYVNRKVQQ